MESDNDSESSSVSDGSSRDDSESDSSSNSSEWEDLNVNFIRRLQPMKDNDPNVTELYGSGDNEFIQYFTDEEWLEFGRALSKNTHLNNLQLFRGALNDHKMSLLFRGLTLSSSIKCLCLHENELGTGITSMLPFLQNARNLVTLSLDHNSIQSEGFNVLLMALCDSTVKLLHCCGCNIESIHIDNDQYPAKLEALNLNRNRINEDGCRGLAKLLLKPDCALKRLDLSNNHVNDTGVENLVDALQKNSSLTVLRLQENMGMSIDGKIMLLKLVNDISSVEATLQSNHTLQTISLGIGFSFDEQIFRQQINFVTMINIECGGDAEAAGREKMIQFQLHSERRSDLAELQKVHQSVYSEINPLHLPEVLSLVGHRHGQGELFAAVKSSIAALMSTVNRKRWIMEKRDYYLARAEQLTAELAAIEAEERGGAKTENDESHRSKRRRKWWWGILGWE